MTAVPILHVDDEPDIRAVVELSLELDPAFIVKSCSSGKDAVQMASEWNPDLILCDVMMPVMDGPATLAHLKEQPQTAEIPVVFMTARAQPRELEQFKTLGASGVIAKPFDPFLLASSVREHLYSSSMTTMRDNFLRRLRKDAAVLSECRAALNDAPDAPTVLYEIKAFVHALAGAAGIFGYQQISRDAAAVENSLIEGGPGEVESTLDALLAEITNAD